MNHYILANNIKCYINKIENHVETCGPVYSYKLCKLLNNYIKYIRLYMPKTKYNYKIITAELLEIYKLLVSLKYIYQDYESIENFIDFVKSSLFSVIYIQYKSDYITDVVYKGLILRLAD